MLLIGIINEVTPHIATDEKNIYRLPKNQKYYLCSLQRINNIVGFENEDALLTNYEFASTGTS